MLCATVFALVEFFHWPLSDHPLALDRDNTLYAIQCVMLAAGPAAVGLLARTRRELADRLSELTRGRQRESRLLADRVLATERARLAREMHDVVSHQVSLISIQAGALQVSTGEPAARESAVTIRELSVRTLEELRQMVGVLRASGVRGDEPLAPQPRLADLPGADRGSGLPVTTHLAPDGPALAGGGRAGRVPDGPGGADQHHQARAGRRGDRPGHGFRLAAARRGAQRPAVAPTPARRRCPAAATAWWGCASAPSCWAARSSPAPPRTAVHRPRLPARRRGLTPGNGGRRPPREGRTPPLHRRVITRAVVTHHVDDHVGRAVGGEVHRRSAIGTITALAIVWLRRDPVQVDEDGWAGAGAHADQKRRSRWVPTTVTFSTTEVAPAGARRRRSGRPGARCRR